MRVDAVTDTLFFAAVGTEVGDRPSLAELDTTQN
jgi:hypothetical protein